MSADLDQKSGVPKVYDIATDGLVPATQEWCDNMQKGNGMMCQQRRVAAWLLTLHPLRQSKVIAEMQAKAHELGMDQP